MPAAGEDLRPVVGSRSRVIRLDVPVEFEDSGIEVRECVLSRQQERSDREHQREQQQPYRSPRM